MQWQRMASYGEVTAIAPGVHLQCMPKKGWRLKPVWTLFRYKSTSYPVPREERALCLLSLICEVHTGSFHCKGVH